MKNTLKPAGIILSAALLALGVACSPKPKPAGPVPQPTPVGPAATPTPTVVRVEKQPETTPQPTPGPIERDDIGNNPSRINAAGYLKPAFFDYDKADIRPDGREVLNANAEWLKKYPGVQITIEGHSDERGTAQYNLALGDRRANAAKEYLASLGIATARMKTISYGKERPFAPGHDEESYQKNRRAHFVVTATR
jgi:peptidoglycan-associated lipoprotein